MNKISNYDLYNQGMAKSMEDKMFWLYQMEELIKTKRIKRVVDYGCADGTFLKNVQLFCRQKQIKYPQLVGIDIDDTMLEKAKKKCSMGIFIKEDSLKEMRLKPSRWDVLNLSSVIHEVYSYCTSDQVNQFWDFVWSGFSYVCIRDMMIDNQTERTYFKDDISELLPDSYQMQIEDFVDHWGSISSMKNLVHFLLKYRYKENWDREINENYLPITVEELLAKIPDNYEILYQEHYTLPFLKEKVFQDFSLTLDAPTHFKLILRKKGGKSY